MCYDTFAASPTEFPTAYHTEEVGPTVTVTESTTFDLYAFCHFKTSTTPETFYVDKTYEDEIYHHSKYEWLFSAVAYIRKNWDNIKWNLLLAILFIIFRVYF